MSEAAQNGNAGNSGEQATGASAADPLFAGDPAPNSGDAGAGGGAAAAQAGGAANNNAAPGAGAAAVTIPANWKDALPSEYKDAPWMKNIADVATLAKSYASVQKLIGADKIPIPGKDATPEQWKAVFQKLGVPEKPEDYKVEMDPKYKDQIDADFLGAFAKQAHTVGVLPTQAKQMAEWFAEVNKAQFDAMQTAQETQIQENLKGLEKEWGEAYKQNVGLAKAALKQFGGEEVTKFVRESGLGRNPLFLKLLAKAGETLSEDQIKGFTGESSGQRQYSPQEARAKINEIKANVKGPYYNPQDPAHEATKKEVRALFEMAFPKVRQEA